MNIFERSRNSEDDSDANDVLRSKAAVIRELLKIGLPQDAVRLDMSSGPYRGSRNLRNKQIDPGENPNKTDEPIIPGANPDFEVPDESYERLGM